MAEHAYDEFDLAASRPEVAVRSFGTPIRSEATPESWDDLERYPEYDFGPLRVRVPAEAQLCMADPDAMYSDAAFFVFPDGKVRLSVLAAPRGGRLWPQRAEEIAAAQANLGADVQSYTGEWGQELKITDDGETNWVIGVDGPRWMLLGRSTCPVGAADDLSHTMRDMIRSSVVFRGNEPLPVRTPLLLREPGSFDADDLNEDRTEGPYAGVVTLILPKVEAPVAADPIDRHPNVERGDHAAGNGVAAVGGAAAVAASVPAASQDWAVAARAASTSPTVDAGPDSRSAAVEPVAETPARRGDDDELARRRQPADIAGAAPRKRGGLLSAAALVALVAIVGLTGLVMAMRGSTPSTAEPSVAAPQQVNERLTPKQTYPDDAYAAAPKVVPQVPAPKVAPPLAAGPALKGRAPVPGVPAAKPATPRPATPVRSNPVPANGAAKPLVNANAARTPSTGPSRSTSSPAVAEPERPGPGHEAASDDYSGSSSRGSRSRSRGDGVDDGQGPIDALSNNVLGVVPGLG